MTTKHTPGPWHVATNPGGPGDQPAFPSVRDNSGLPHGGDIVAMPLGDSVTVKANARLIAAAPDLLATLKDSLTWLETHRRLCEAPHPEGPLCQSIIKAQAAIAKAEGKA